MAKIGSTIGNIIILGYPDIKFVDYVYYDHPSSCLKITERSSVTASSWIILKIMDSLETSHNFWKKLYQKTIFCQIKTKMYLIMLYHCSYLIIDFIPTQTAVRDCRFNASNYITSLIDK